MLFIININFSSVCLDDFMRRNQSQIESKSNLENFLLLKNFGITPNIHSFADDLFSVLKDTSSGNLKVHESLPEDGNLNDLINVKDESSPLGFFL